MVHRYLTTNHRNSVSRTNVSKVRSSFPRNRITRPLIIPIMGHPINSISEPFVVVGVPWIPFPKVRNHYNRRQFGDQPQFMSVSSNPILVDFLVTLTMVVQIVHEPTNRNRSFANLEVRGSGQDTGEVTPKRSTVRTLFDSVLGNAIRNRTSKPFLVEGSPFRNQQGSESIIIVNLRTRNLLTTTSLVVRRRFSTFRTVIVFTSGTSSLNNRQTIQVGTSIFVTRDRTIRFFFFGSQFGNFVFFVIRLTIRPSGNHVLFRPIFSGVFKGPRVQYRWVDRRYQVLIRRNQINVGKLKRLTSNRSLTITI